MYKQLPDYPSELLQLALDDIEVIEKDEDYKIKTSVWHDYDKDEGVCCVCIAGAVLANTLKFNKNTLVEYIEDIKDEIGVDNHDKLVVIDRLRQLRLNSLYGGYKYKLFGTEIILEEAGLIDQTISKLVRRAFKASTTYNVDDIIRFKYFKKSYDFFSSIIEDIAHLDKEILGMK